MFSGLFQPMHLIVILVIVLVIFGPGKLPELGEGLAKGIKSFKKGIKDSTEAAKDETKTVPLEHKDDKPA
jgi:sec-independent protein translocase protein TatA